MIDSAHPELSIQEQCDLLSLSRSTYYDNRKSPELMETILSDPDEPLMQLVDEIFTELPFYGSRKMVYEILTRTGWIVNRKKVRRIMRKMGLEAIVPWKDTTSRTLSTRNIHTFCVGSKFAGWTKYDQQTLPTYRLARLLLPSSSC